MKYILTDSLGQKEYKKWKEGDRSKFYSVVRICEYRCKNMQAETILAALGRPDQTTHFSDEHSHYSYNIGMPTLGFLILNNKIEKCWFYYQE